MIITIPTLNRLSIAIMLILWALISIQPQPELVIAGLLTSAIVPAAKVARAIVRAFNLV